MYDQSALGAARNSLSVIGPPRTPTIPAGWNSAAGGMSFGYIVLPARALFCCVKCVRRKPRARSLRLGWHDGGT